MDELTRERYPHGVPYEELCRPGTKPAPPAVPDRVIRMRRLILCGTSDLEVQEPGGDQRSHWRARDRRLVRAIRGLQDAP